MAGLSKERTKRSPIYWISILKIDPFNKNANSNIKLEGCEEGVGISFEESQNLLVLAYNEYTPGFEGPGSRKFKKSYLK